MSEGLWFYFWTTLGIVGGVLFWGRFYVQWIVSEMKRQSVMPVAFWYMSAAGSLMLLGFAVWSQSPLGALGQNVNIVIYARNLMYIRKEAGVMSERGNVAMHAVLILIAISALGFVGYTWLNEYRLQSAAEPEQARQAWMWLAVGVAGQALFAARFLIQWIATEREKKSVIPTAFWYFSVGAAALQCAAFTARSEWIFAVGMLATIVIYLRNLWFIHMRPAEQGQVALNG